MRKLKFKSAEEKRRYEENQRSWEQLKKKYEQPIVKVKKPIKQSWSAGVVVPPGRECSNLPSLSTPGGSTALKPSMTYTGTAMKGIGTMHKSNLVPVFDDDAAKDIASMRR